jgi:hypothetical protein
MAFAELTLPGVAGTVVTEYAFWSGFKFLVNGERVKAHGFPRNKLALPGTHGPVEAKVKGGMLRAHPVLVVGGTDFPTGPPTPAIQQVLALLPLIGLAIVQGVLGFLIAFGGLAITMGVVRSERSGGAKVGLIIATVIAVVVIDLVLVIAILTTLGG